MTPEQLIKQLSLSWQFTTYADPERIKFHTGSSAIILRSVFSSAISVTFLPQSSFEK